MKKPSLVATKRAIDQSFDIGDLVINAQCDFKGCKDKQTIRIGDNNLCREHAHLYADRKFLIDMARSF